jgi:benzoate-CoA ligase family protein
MSESALALRGDEDVPPFPERLNLAGYFLDHNLAAGRGAKVAVVDDLGEQTYAEVHAASCRVANALRRMRVEQEDRVLVALPDGRDFVAAWFGAARAGAVITMVNVILPEEDYAYYLEYTRAKVAIVDAGLERIFERLRGRSRHLREVIVARSATSTSASTKLPSLAEVMSAESSEAETAPTHRDDPAIWLFTSGSTGRAKACMHLQHDLPWNTERYAKRVLGMKESDRTVGVPKLFFGYATGTNLLFPFAVGGSAALFRDRSTAAKLFEVIERARPTVLTSVPTMIASMLDDPRIETADLSSLRVCLSAGEALPAELYRRWKATTGVEILDGIGSAEMFHIYITNKPGDVTPGSLGTLVPGYDAKIVDEDEREVPVGDVGTLWVRGDSAMTGYWLEHEKSKRTIRGEWCASADQFRRDAEGRFWYAGRADDLLKVSGIFVSPLEIENCLLEHDAIAECCVVGWNAGRDLVKPLAFVVARAGRATGEALAEEVQRHVKARLAPYKYPRRVVFLEEMPKNERGKVDRKALRERAAAIPPG